MQNALVSLVFVHDVAGSIKIILKIENLNLHFERNCHIL